MAPRTSGLIDFLSLFTTVVLFIGAIFLVIYVARKISQGVEYTKENLKNKGINISDHGLSVKTKKHLDREEYLDATQRGIIKAMGASSFGHAADNGQTNAHGQGVAMSRTASSNGNGGDPANGAKHIGERRHLFRRTHSAGSTK